MKLYNKNNKEVNIKVFDLFTKDEDEYNEIINNLDDYSKGILLKNICALMQSSMNIYKPFPKPIRMLLEDSLKKLIKEESDKYGFF